MPRRLGAGVTRDRRYSSRSHRHSDTQTVSSEASEAARQGAASVNLRLVRGTVRGTVRGGSERREL